MKRCIIVVISILCLSIMLSSFVCQTYAVGIDTVVGKEDEYKKDTDESSDQAALNIANTVVWVVRTVGQSIAVIMLLVIGIKYIMGSVEQKAEYKQSMLPYFIGAILIFAGASITQIIYSVFIK